MILILLSWLYIFFTAFSIGVAFSKVIRIRQFDIITTTILGLFSITLLATIWAFFGAIAIGFHVVLVLLAVFFWHKNKASFTSILKETVIQIKSFSYLVKILFAISSLLVVAQSATLPFKAAIISSDSPLSFKAFTSKAADSSKNPRAM